MFNTIVFCLVLAALWYFVLIGHQIHRIKKYMTPMVIPTLVNQAKLLELARKEAEREWKRALILKRRGELK